MNVASWILDNGAPGEKVALLSRRSSYTYSELRQGVDQVAAYLVQAGLRKGDRVALMADNSFFWVTAYLGTILAGGVAVPLPPRIDAAQGSHILGTTGCVLGFVQSEYAEGFRSLAQDGLEVVAGEAGQAAAASHALAGSGEGLAASDVPSIQACDVDDAVDLAVLMFTSGSTGKPRGVMVSHRNILANTSSIIEYVGLSAEDRMMAVLPFHYCFGTSLLHTHLRVGGSLAIETQFTFPNRVLKYMQETRCTGFAGVPSIYQILLRRSNLKGMEFPHLRHVQQAGGRLPDVFISELRSALPAARIFVMYGQTEATARLSYLPPEMLDTKLGSIGMGIPGVKLEVLDEEGKPVPLGTVGEIVAQGQNITLGYWNAPSETEQSFRRNKLYTGDLARVDEDGYIFVVDRAKDFLKCGGQRVSCREIESKVLQFQGLVEAAVIGQEDDTLGEAVRLYVVHPRGDAVRAPLEQFCTESLPPHLVPRAVVFLDELPKNSSGKLDKMALKREYRAQLESEGRA